MPLRTEAEEVAAAALAAAALAAEALVAELAAAVAAFMLEIQTPDMRPLTRTGRAHD